VNRGEDEPNRMSMKYGGEIEVQTRKREIKYSG
jgi:hypothetical protein